VHLRLPRRASLLVALSAVLTCACGQAVDNTRSIDAEIAPPSGLATPGHLTVAVPSDLPPYGYRAAAGSDGLDVDIAAAMAARMGLRLSVVALDPQDLSAAARGGGVDVVLGTVEQSSTAPPPPDLILVPYLRDQGEFLVPQDGEYQPHQLSELCGRNVTVVAGTAQESLLAQAVRICGGAPPGVVSVATDGEALSALRSGSAAVYLVDSATAAFDRVRRGDVMTTDVQVGDTELAMGMRAGGTPLTDAITRAFYLIHSDGTYEVLLQKWGMIPETL